MKKRYPGSRHRKRPYPSYRWREARPCEGYKECFKMATLKAFGELANLTKRTILMYMSHGYIFGHQYKARLFVVPNPLCHMWDSKLISKFWEKL